MGSLPSIRKKPFFAAEPSRAEWLIRSGDGGRVAKKVEMTMQFNQFDDK
jgi:hypothetical protein